MKSCPSFPVLLSPSTVWSPYMIKKHTPCVGVVFYFQQHLELPPGITKRFTVNKQRRRLPVFSSAKKTSINSE